MAPLEVTSCVHFSIVRHTKSASRKNVIQPTCDDKAYRQPVIKISCNIVTNIFNRATFAHSIYTREVVFAIVRSYFFIAKSIVHCEQLGLIHAKNEHTSKLISSIPLHPLPDPLYKEASAQCVRMYPDRIDHHRDLSLGRNPLSGSNGS